MKTLLELTSLAAAGLNALLAWNRIRSEKDVVVDRPHRRAA